MTIETDVLVCGGGCAGLAAALAAARNGAKTLLVERAGFAGGIITTVGLPYFDGIARARDNRVVVGGIAMELLAKMGVCEPGAERVAQHNPTIKNIEQFKLLADRLLAAEAPRLAVLFHSAVCEVNTSGDRIREVLVANKDGLVRIAAKTVIDCTGDGDVAAWSGAPVVKTEPLQPMTLHFRIGNVKRNADLQRRCREELIAAHKAGELNLFYGPGVMFLFAANEAYIHAIRVAADASVAAELTRAEMQGRADAWTMFERWKKNVPGFEEAYFVTSGPYVGVRETRRIDGAYVLTEEDIRQQRQFDDAVATGCWYLDLHPNRATPGAAQEKKGFQPDQYDIPYRSLLPRKLANLLVAGRCHSATQLAASSTRVTVTAMAMGQAAGTAAALALQSREMVAELSGEKVRRTLEAQHAGPYREA
ncbi:MAG TPA: FAD-dependent oxidoreductase [Pirellulales bacterium]|nr:FAD-dependent oxidoreductase [Pirellulales bacterium]